MRPRLRGAIISKWNDLLCRLRQSNHEILYLKFAMRMQNTAILYTYQGIIRFYRSYYLVIYGNWHNKQLKIFLFWRRDTRKKNNNVYTVHWIQYSHFIYHLNIGMAIIQYVRSKNKYICICIRMCFTKTLFVSTQMISSKLQSNHQMPHFKQNLERHHFNSWMVQ